MTREEINISSITYGTIEIYGRQPLKIFTLSILEYLVLYYAGLNEAFYKSFEQKVTVFNTLASPSLVSDGTIEKRIF